MHLFSLCQTWLNLKTHNVSETENRTSCLTTLVRQSQSVAAAGGGGGWHKGGEGVGRPPGRIAELAAPIGLLPLTLVLSWDPFPPQMAVPIGPVPSLSLPGLSSPPYFPLVSLGRLCQQSPWTVLLCCSVSGPQRAALAIGQAQGVQAATPIPAVEDPLPNGGFWGPGCPLAGPLPQRHLPAFNPPLTALSPACGKRILCPPTPSHRPLGPWCVCCVHDTECVFASAYQVPGRPPFPRVAWMPLGVMGRGWCGSGVQGGGGAWWLGWLC